MENKKNKLLIGLIALLLVVGVGVATYARYISTYEGNDTVDVADWKVTLKQGDQAVSNNFELAFTLDNTQSNAKEGTIAPGSVLTSELTLDLTGTEVATDYEINLSEVTGIPDGMTITSVKATVGTAEAQTLTETSTGSGIYQGSLTLEQVTNTPTVEFEIIATWTNDEANNTNDTSFGTSTDTITIPVTVTAKQHIGA